jgi:hypothetical protein
VGPRKELLHGVISSTRKFWMSNLDENNRWVFAEFALCIQHGL